WNSIASMVAKQDEARIDPPRQDAIAVVFLSADGSRQRSVVRHGFDYSSAACARKGTATQLRPGPGVRRGLAARCHRTPSKKGPRHLRSGEALRSACRPEEVVDAGRGGDDKWSPASQKTSGAMTTGTNAKAQSAVRGTLLALYEAAVAAAHPDLCLPSHLPPP